MGVFKMLFVIKTMEFAVGLDLVYSGNSNFSCTQDNGHSFNCISNESRIFIGSCESRNKMTHGLEFNCGGKKFEWRKIDFTTILNDIRNDLLSRSIRFTSNSMKFINCILVDNDIVEFLNEFSDDCENFVNITMVNENINMPIILLPKNLFYNENRNHPEIMYLSIDALGFDGSVWESDLTNLTTLRTLKLRSNDILEINYEFMKNFPDLEQLIIAGNSIINRICSGTFTKQTNLLLLLNFNFNLHFDVFEDSFDGLSSLLYMHLNGNELQSIDEGSFKYSPQMTVITMEYNMLNNLPENLFSFSRNLIRLSVRNNLIEFLPRYLLFGLENLLEIDLSSNRLTTIPSDFFSQSPLVESILIDNNMLNNISG